MASMRPRVVTSTGTDLASHRVGRYLERKAGVRWWTPSYLRMHRWTRQTRCSLGVELSQGALTGHAVCSANATSAVRAPPEPSLG
jgi:hypothetical protein